MAPESKDSDFAELEDKKIKAVASPKEKREFDTGSDLDRVLYKLEKQKLHLRWPLALLLSLQYSSLVT